MIPRLALFNCTTSAADDARGTGPEYEGRTLCITWWRWTLEITLATRSAR